MDLNTARLTLRTKVGSPTEDEVSNETLTRILNAAYREIGSKYPFHETRCIKSFDTVAGTPRYTVPTDIAVLWRVWDSTNNKKLIKRGVRFLATVPAGQENDKPRSYVRAKDWIQLIPPPDAAYTINIYYLTEVQDLVADTDEFAIPLPWHDGIILRARHLYYDERGDIGKAIYCKNEWKDWLSDKPSEIDMEKDDLEDAGVIIPTLGGEHPNRRGFRDRRFDALFDETL